MACLYRQCEQEKAQGLKYLDQQKREQAVKHLQKAVHVTWEMIQRVIKVHTNTDIYLYARLLIFYS